MAYDAEAKAEHEAHVRTMTPHALGSEHFWGWWPWENPPESKEDVAWAHPCSKHGDNPEAILVVGRCDVTSGERHKLISKEPLTIEGSLLCRSCGDHGWIRDGVWVRA